MSNQNQYPTNSDDDDQVIEAEAEIVGQEIPRQDRSYQFGPHGYRHSRVFVYRSDGCNCSCCLGCLLLIVLIFAILGSFVI